MRRLGVLFFFLALPLSALGAFTLPERPTAHINDYAHVLTSEAKAGLEARFSAFEQRTGHQAAVAIFAALDGDSIEDVATKMFEKWRLGSKKENDGVLLVLSMQEHGIRIETGYGMEAKLPDGIAGRIIHDDMVPFLRQNQVATAILAFEKRLEDIFIEGKVLRPLRTNSRASDKIPGWAWFLLIMGALSFARFLGWGATHRGRQLNSRGTSWYWGGWGGGWGGGGSGWGGGGGGSSGGGGASGSW